MIISVFLYEYGLFFVLKQGFNVAKHITCIQSMKHRYNVLATRYALRADTLPEDSLLALLRDGFHYTKLDKYIYENVLYLFSPDPVPNTASLVNFCNNYWQDQMDRQHDAAVVSGTQALLRACRPPVSHPDPILYLHICRTARSHLVRRRLSRYTNMREECPCRSPFDVYISRDHFLFCRVFDSDLLDALPAVPFGVHKIDYHYGKKGVEWGINYNFSEKTTIIFATKTVLY